MAQTVVGLFDNYSDAQSAVNELVNNGFAHSDVSMVASNAHDNFVTEDGGQVVQRGSVAGGVVAGAAEGAVLGGLTGFAASVALFLIPGIGPVVGAGALAATLSGAGLGAVGGGAIGGLSRVGIPEEQAGYYAEGVRRGGTLVTVSAPDDTRADLASNILDRFNAADIDQRGGYYRSTGYTGYNETAPAYNADQVASDRAAYTNAFGTVAPMTTIPELVTTGAAETVSAPVLEDPSVNNNPSVTRSRRYLSDISAS